MKKEIDWLIALKLSLNRPHLDPRQDHNVLSVLCLSVPVLRSYQRWSPRRRAGTCLQNVGPAPFLLLAINSNREFGRQWWASISLGERETVEKEAREGGSKLLSYLGFSAAIGIKLSLHHFKPTSILIMECGPAHHRPMWAGEGVRVRVHEEAGCWEEVLDWKVRAFLCPLVKQRRLDQYCSTWRLWPVSGSWNQFKGS